MKIKIFLLLVIILTPQNFAQTERWTVHDVYEKRIWKIVSYDHHSQGYSVLMKQIRHFLITDVNIKTVQPKIDFQFCNEYRYKIDKNNPEYELTHSFFSKFGKHGSLDFPSVFNSNMKTVDPYFENFMKEMLGQKTDDLQIISKPKEKIWKYKPVPKNLDDVWKIKSLEKFTSYYTLIWVNKNKNKFWYTYIFSFSKKHIMLEHILNEVKKENLLKQYWNSEKNPNKDFFYFMIDYLKIKSEDTVINPNTNITNENPILLLECINIYKRNRHELHRYSINLSLDGNSSYNIYSDSNKELLKIWQFLEITKSKKIKTHFLKNKTSFNEFMDNIIEKN